MYEREREREHTHKQREREWKREKEKKWPALASILKWEIVVNPTWTYQLESNWLESATKSWNWWPNPVWSWYTVSASRSAYLRRFFYCLLTCSDLPPMEFLTDIASSWLHETCNIAGPWGRYEHAYDKIMWTRTEWGNTQVTSVIEHSQCRSCTPRSSDLVEAVKLRFSKHGHV